MEENTNVTTSGEVDATSQDVVTDSTATTEVATSENDTSIDTAETNDSTATESEIEQTTVTEPNWEASYKELQSSFTKVSQELAELKRAQEPKYVDESGQITPEYQQEYQFDIDNREFLAYDQLSRQLEPETRAEVERLLNEAKGLYRSNKMAYNQKLLEIKNYFNSDIVEQIALDKRNLENQMAENFEKVQQEHKQQRAVEMAQLLSQSKDMQELLYSDSENYSQDVFGIVKELFDLTGGIDLEILTNAVSSIKALGVKEHLAQQKLQTERQKATVPTNGVPTVNSQTLTKEYAQANYREACKKYGMEAVDKVIMKG